MAIAKNKNIEFEEYPSRSVIKSSTSQFDDVDALLLDIDGYEGPIDLLLELARNQKVDLVQISILQLVRQYLGFVERAKAMNLDLAVEYLVMAAWLAYLKSRLLLPRDEEEFEYGAAEMAEALQFQLQRLEAMQNAAENFKLLPQLGKDVFARGIVEGLKTKTNTYWDVNLYDMLKAYGDIQHRSEDSHYDLPEYNFMSAEDAFSRLTRMLGELPRKGIRSIWTTLESFIPEGIKDRVFCRSALAATLTASLELVKQGKLEIKQDGLFKQVYMRSIGDVENAKIIEESSGESV
ncbi:MAG: segregation/condensation protein A [Alphaproteobacteria bacterium]|nr:segregation/condensation protein A [Alphaproteobacteria bacterium]